MEDAITNQRRLLAELIQVQDDIYRLRLGEQNRYYDQPFNVADIVAVIERYEQSPAAANAALMFLQKIEANTPIQTLVPLAFDLFQQQLDLSRFIFISSRESLRSGDARGVPVYSMHPGHSRGIHVPTEAEKSQLFHQLVHRVVVPTYLRFFDVGNQVQPGLAFNWKQWPSCWPRNLRNMLVWCSQTSLEDCMDKCNLREPKWRALVLLLLSNVCWSADRLRITPSGNTIEDGAIEFIAGIEPCRSEWFPAAQAPVVLPAEEVAAVDFRATMQLHKKEGKSGKNPPFFCLHPAGNGFFNWAADDRTDDVVEEGDAAPRPRKRARQQCNQCGSRFCLRADAPELVRYRDRYSRITFLDTGMRAWDTATKHVMIRNDLLAKSPWYQSLRDQRRDANGIVDLDVFQDMSAPSHQLLELLCVFLAMANANEGNEPPFVCQPLEFDDSKQRFKLHQARLLPHYAAMINAAPGHWRMIEMLRELVPLTQIAGLLQLPVLQHLVTLMFARDAFTLLSRWRRI